MALQSKGVCVTNHLPRAEIITDAETQLELEILMRHFRKTQTCNWGEGIGVIVYQLLLFRMLKLIEHTSMCHNSVMTCLYFTCDGTTANYTAIIF